MRWRKAKESQPAGKSVESGEYGNGGSRTIGYVTTSITGGISTTFIGTQSSITWFAMWPIGPIRVFTGTLNKVSIHKTGVASWNQRKFLLANNANDAVRRLTASYGPAWGVRRVIPGAKRNPFSTDISDCVNKQ